MSAAITLIAAFYTGAQVRPDFNRPQTFDVQHYVLRVSFDRAKKQVFGDTTVSLKPIKADLKVVELDAVGLSFESVKLEPSGIDLQHTLADSKVIITMDRPYGIDEPIELRFKYKATPKKGIYFVDAESGKNSPARSHQIWTQGEPDEARHWFPAFDFPSDKATTEQFITVQPDETVVGNGELIDKTDNPDGNVTWHFRMKVPYSTYLVSFVIGKYIRIGSSYKDIPLGFYTYPGQERTAMNAFGETKEMMRAFEELTGVQYPYNKYDQTIVAGFQFGGMENITATTLADTEVQLVNLDFGKGLVRDLVAHELAHSWFGNLVTCRNWAELWLNEGFATYMEAAYIEKTGGRDAYLTKVRSDAAQFLVSEEISRKKHALFNQRAGDVSTLFDNPTTTYNKGGAVVHTLREQVGSDAFWRGVNIYLNRHKFANVETADLRQAMEEASGQDLDWFFDQWVYGQGAPKLNIRQTYSARTKTLTLTITQTHKATAEVPAAFRLPIDIEITTAGGKRSLKPLEITGRQRSFTFKLGSKPTEIVIDPQLRVPLKTVKQSAIAPVK